MLETTERHGNETGPTSIKEQATADVSPRAHDQIRRSCFPLGVPGRAERSARLPSNYKMPSPLGAITEREGVSRQRLNQVLKLAFLSPDLVGKILDGRQPEGLTMDRLSRSPRLDLWKDQRDWAARLAD